MDASKLILTGSALCIILISLIAPGLCANGAVVNIMIDADINPSATPEQTKMASDNIINMMNVVDPKGLNFTIYVTGDMAKHNRLPMTYQGMMPNHELALHGMTDGEKLSQLAYSDQSALLKEAMDLVHKCYVCGGKQLDLKGFRPQLFDQNADTYRVLEEMGFAYDSGFQAGVLYAPGHKNDTWPYLIENQKLYAVPVSTYDVSGQKVLLFDRTARDAKIGSSQWYEILTGKFDEAEKNGEPMVVIFSNLVSGNGDYLDAYTKFIDYAISRKATFVTSMQLVEKSIAMKPAASPVAVAASTEPACPDCGKPGGSLGNLSIGIEVKRASNCTLCNETLGNLTNQTAA